MYRNIFDTHSHYDDRQFDADRDFLLENLKNNGVCKIVSCGCDIETTEFNKQLACKYDYFYFAAGFHPECLENTDLSEAVHAITTYAENKKCVAVGEIGLDYHWMSSSREKQKEFFTAQIETAKQLNLPVIVHDREAHKDTLDILKSTKPSGVVHCFSYAVNLAEEFVAMGYFIGVGGVVTFKNGKKLVETVKKIPLEKILLETDAPYLSPEPFRGSRNDSSNLVYAAERIAQIKGITADEVIDVTRRNGERLFHIN